MQSIILAPAAFGAALLLVAPPATAQLAGNGNSPVAVVAVADTTRPDTASAPSAARPIVRPPALLDRRDLLIGATFTAAAVAMFPIDDRLARWSQAPARQDNAALKGALLGAEWWVETGTLVVGAGLWASGIMTRKRPIAESGFHTLAAIGVTSQITSVLKGAFGRSRPYVTADSMSNDFQWGTGFRAGTDRRSFPSGHTSSGFAFATAMSHEIREHWPRAGRIATPLLYAGATAAGAARIYQDKHWASDVAMGAAVGIVSARATLRFLHGRPQNLFDRLALGATIMPDGQGGGTVAFSVPVK